MGDTGPCGPSSEIFWDNGPDLGPEGGPANPASEDRYVEIWNLVFPQYLRGADGQLSDLPSKNIDTGAGLERILAVLAGSPSLYAADTLSTLVDEAQSVTGHRLGESELGDIALRLMADHARTMTFLVADGVIPSNEDRGYVLRRIIRRAIRFAYLLGVERPVLPAMVERTIDVMGDAYPEVVEGRDLVLPIITREEESFRRTLATGSQILDTQLDRLEPGGTLPGAVAFQLHDTYGFPFEVTQETADLRGFAVDVAGFDSAMDEQRRRARAASKAGASPPATRSPSSSGSWPSTAPPCSRGATSTRPRRRSSASWATASTSTARRSTPRRAARWATPATSSPPPASWTWSTPPTGCPACTSTRSWSARARSRWARRPTPASTPSAATPSAATTPARTSCTGPCARCWAPT